MPIRDFNRPIPPSGRDRNGFPPPPPFPHHTHHHHGEPDNAQEGKPQKGKNGAIIRIKRSSSATEAPKLRPGELAYSWAYGIDKLWIGLDSGTDSDGFSEDVAVIGGAHYERILKAIDSVFEFDEEGNVVSLRKDNDILKDYSFDGSIKILADDLGEKVTVISSSVDEDGNTVTQIDSDKTIVKGLTIETESGAHVEIDEYIENVYGDVIEEATHGFEERIEKIEGDLDAPEDYTEGYKYTLKASKSEDGTWTLVWTPDNSNIDETATMDMGEHSTLAIGRNGSVVVSEDSALNVVGDSSNVTLSGNTTIGDTDSNISIVGDVSTSGKVDLNGDVSISGDVSIDGEKTESVDGDTTIVTEVTNIGGATITTTTESVGDSATTNTVLSSENGSLSVETPFVVGANDSAEQQSKFSVDVEKVSDGVYEATVTEDDEIESSLSVKGGLDLAKTLSVGESVVVAGSIVSTAEDDESILGGFVIDQGTF